LQKRLFFLLNRGLARLKRINGIYLENVSFPFCQLSMVNGEYVTERTRVRRKRVSIELQKLVTKTSLFPFAISLRFYGFDFSLLTYFIKPLFFLLHFL